MRKFVLIATVLALAAPAGAVVQKQHPQHPQHPNWVALDRDVHPAIYYAASTWGVSYSWLHACAHSEGGHGRYVDTPGDGKGWFQFLYGTWDWMSNEAWKAGRRLGPHKTPPTKYKVITSKLGQAWTAAWAFKKGYSYHWYGSGC